MFPPLRHISRPLAGQRPAALNFLTVRSGPIICLLFLLAGLVLAGDYGISPDEPNQRRTAQDNLDYILGRADGVVTEIYHDRVYGVALELPLLLAEGVLGLTDLYEVHRLRATLTHLFFILGGFFCYRLAWRLSDNRLIAILALLIYLLHPRLYAQSYLNSKDPAFLSMFVIALYLLERAFRRDTLGAFLLLGIAVGLLTNLRIMGAMLLPAALAMRGLDGFYAGTGPERKRILRTAGLFFLAAALTLYALSPYAWTNPIDYLALNLNLTVNHPNTWLQLFQGELIRSYELPPHYAAVWFGITTPPLFLLLGFIGMAVVAVRAIRRPGAALRNSRRRFLLLLTACFLLPPLAAALLGATQYEGWRHLYFVYGPFCLLAALGGGGLAAGLTRRRRAGMYGLAGLGLGLILLQLIQLHPLQYVYFNFLVDRATPEYLRTQYETDYWRLAPRAALEYLLKQHPGETLAVRMERQYRETLPAAARQRLIRAGGGPADYELFRQIAPSQPDLVFNSRYGRFYNNAFVAARPLAAARMTPAARAAYQEIYRQATAGEPILRADYNVYLNGKRLVFVRENCPPDSRDAWLGGRLFPHHIATLPPEAWNPGSYATFGNHRVRLGAICLAVVQLPDYAQGDLILMRRGLDNFGPAGAPLWAELYSLSQPGLRDLIADYRRRQPRPPAAGPAAFEVFLDRAEGRNRLLYAKAACAPADYETRIFLHIAPVNLGDLPTSSRGRNFENRDFPLDYYGGRPGGDCVAIVPLPDYPLASLRTGQAGRWEMNLYPPADPGRLPALYRAAAGREPAAHADFDLYIQDNRLIYLRETCAAADTAAGFFLHIIPENVADLPAERQAAGFANLDFAFDRWGGLFDGKCLAAIPLPDYPLKEIRTGQFHTEQGELWAAEWAVE